MSTPCSAHGCAVAALLIVLDSLAPAYGDEGLAHVDQTIADFCAKHAPKIEGIVRSYAGVGGEREPLALRDLWDRTLSPERLDEISAVWGRRVEPAMDEKDRLSVALTVVGVVVAIAAGAVARWQERLFKRQGEVQTWAIDLRKLLSAFRLATIGYTKRIASGPSELERQGSEPRFAYQAAWNIWSHEVATKEHDLFAYLDTVGFVEEALRRDAASAFTRFEGAARDSILEYMIRSAEDYTAVIEDLIVRVDKQLGLETAMTAAKKDGKVGKPQRDGPK